MQIRGRAKCSKSRVFLKRLIETHQQWMDIIQRSIHTIENIIYSVTKKSNDLLFWSARIPCNYLLWYGPAKFDLLLPSLMYCVEFLSKRIALTFCTGLIHLIVELVGCWQILLFIIRRQSRFHTCKCFVFSFLIWIDKVVIISFE